MDYTLLKSEFFGLVGFRDATGTLSTSLKASSSGKYFGSVDPLITIENLTAIKNPNQTIDEFLTDIVQDGIVGMIDDWKTFKTLSGSGRNLLDYDTMIKCEPTQELSDWSNIGGLMFRTRDSQSLVYDFQLSLHLVESASIAIKVFESGQNDPVHEQTLEYDTPKSIKWFDIGYQLKGQKTYYIVYDMTGVQAYNNMDYSYFPKGRFCTSIGIRHDFGIDNLWDVTQHTEVENDNFGLNLKVNITCDYTALLVKQKNIFADALCKKVGIMLLESLAANPHAKVNKNEANISPAAIRYKIDGYGSEKNNSKMDYSLMRLYNDSLKAISFDTAGIDKYCIKCKNKRVRVGTI